MQHIARFFTLALNNLPWSHRVIFGFLIVLIFLIVIWRSSVYYYNAAPMIKIVKLEKKETYPLSSKSNEISIYQIKKKNMFIQQDTLNKTIKGLLVPHRYVVSPGDTLSRVLHQYGIDMRDIIQLTEADKELCHLKIGQQFYFVLAPDGNIHRLVWEISHHEVRAYLHKENGFEIKREKPQNSWINNLLKKSSISGQCLSRSYDLESFIRNKIYYLDYFTYSEISEVVKEIQCKICLNKLKNSDELATLIARRKMKDIKIYKSNSISLIKDFLRFPTSRPFRISSRFNLHRHNPITGRVTPHRGVDFAMPQGTPVLVVGDGEVIVAKHSSAAGYYIVVRHGRVYTTRYMHLCKLLVKPGQKVKRGDRIALSGNTGRSTGPHLHYEVWINRQAVNPLTVQLSNIKHLKDKDRTRHLQEI